MTESTESVPIAEPGDSLPGKLFCYRCASVLEDNSDWCGGCGASQVSTCHKCAAIYRKSEGRCPACGTRRIRRRMRRRSFKVFYRESVQAWIDRNRRKILFICAGFAGGIAAGVILKILADASMPQGMTHDTNEMEFWTEPFVAAAKTFLRLVMGAAESIWNVMVYLVLMHLKTTILAVLGAVVGLFFAIRSERRRSRRRHTRY